MMRDEARNEWVKESRKRERSTGILQRLMRRLCTENISFSKPAFCQKKKKPLIPRNVPVCWLLEIRE